MKTITTTAHVGNREYDRHVRTMTVDELLAVLVGKPGDMPVMYSSLDSGHATTVQSYCIDAGYSEPVLLLLEEPLE